MTFQERFDDVVSRQLGGGGRGSHVEKVYLASNRATLLDVFLSAVIHGSHCGAFFEVFSTPVNPQERLRFPLPYIPIILQFLGENDGVALYDSLMASAETVETGRDWELVVVFSIYIRSLAAKHCKLTAGGDLSRGPFNIATNGVDDVRVITIPSEVTDIVQAVTYIQESTQEAKTVYLFLLAYSRFPDFDGFVSYRSLKRLAGQQKAPTIHGFQCKLSRGHPRHSVDIQHIARRWFIRGRTTIKTPDSRGWTYPTEEEINTNLLGFGLRLLHPMSWGFVPDADGFD
eukprot:scaffold4530_cov163-Ochromonas_danica.AAC.2